MQPPGPAGCFLVSPAQNSVAPR